VSNGTPDDWDIPPGTPPFPPEWFIPRPPPPPGNCNFVDMLGRPIYPGCTPPTPRPVPTPPLPGITEFGTLANIERQPRARVRPNPQRTIGGAPAPAPSPSPPPSRPAPRRRRTRRSRPPARPRRPIVEPTRPDAPRPKVIPSIPSWLPRILTRNPINPVSMVLEFLDLYIRGPLRPPTGGPPRRGGARNRQAPPVPQPVNPAVPAPSPLPAPVTKEVPFEYTLNNPIAPSYDPFVLGRPATGRSPSAAPAARPRPAPSRLFSLTPAGLLDVFPGGSALTRLRPRPTPRTSPQPRPPRGRQPGRPLTPQQLGRITRTEPDSDPCAVRVRELKRRQRKKRAECKEFETKTIKVCKRR
jgi:hypothetical protein